MLLALAIIAIAVMALIQFQLDLTQSRHVLLRRIRPNGLDLGGRTSIGLLFIRTPDRLIGQWWTLPVIDVIIPPRVKPVVVIRLSVLLGLDLPRRAVDTTLVLANGAIRFGTRSFKLPAICGSACLITRHLDLFDRTLQFLIRLSDLAHIRIALIDGQFRGSMDFPRQARLVTCSVALW